MELWFILVEFSLWTVSQTVLNLISELIYHAFLLSEYIIHTH